MAPLCLAVLAASMASGVSYVHVDLSLNRMQAPAMAIGLNASMSALAWLLTTPFLPSLLRHRLAHRLLPSLVAATMAAAFGFLLTEDQTAWLLLRFLFSGSLGLMFRLVEYWLSASAPADRRSRRIGLYAGVFCAGVAAGAALVALVGVGVQTVLLIIALLGVSLAVFVAMGAAPPRLSDADRGTVGMPWLGHPVSVALLAALVAGLFDAVPYTFMPIYAVHAGLGEDWAAWTASVFMLGALVAPVPLGALADRTRKINVLAGCTAVALLVPAALSLAPAVPAALLPAVFLWGGAANGFYVAALSMLADRFPEKGDLVRANVAFGLLNAAGSLVGPFLHGAAMDWHDPQGVLASSAVLFAVFLPLLLQRRRSLHP